MGNALLSPFAATSPGQILTQYSEWIYFALVVVFFIAVSGLALRRHFDRPYVKPLIITVGLAMAFAVFKNRRVLTMIFEGWGTLGSILLVCLTAAIPFSLARGFGMDKSRAAWLAYGLLYLISWAHLPEFYHGLNTRGLGLASAIMLILFLYAIWRVIKSHGPQSSSTDWVVPDKSRPTQIKRESALDKAEERSIKKDAVPLTIREVRSVEDMEKALVELEDALFAASPYISPQTVEHLARQVEAVMGKEKLFKVNLARLDKIFKRLGVLDEEQLRDKKTRMKKASGKERKILKAELQRQEEIVLIERTVRELERRLAANLEPFENDLVEAASLLRGLHPMRDAARLVSEARSRLRGIKSIVLSFKDLEGRMVQIVKLERSLLGKERKAA